MLRMEIALFLVLCAVLLFGNWRSLDRKKRFVIGAALVIEFTVCALQGLHHTWLISGMGLTLMTLAFYLTLENPDILRGELMEQKLSQAAYLLAKTDLPTESIFHSVGYENSSFFYRKFKEAYGMSPREYRTAKQSERSEF